MANQDVPNVLAVTEYHRKNSPPWQADVPYAINDIVFGSNGNVYKCILANNTTGPPYNDPKDPSNEANAAYWELASGGGGTSISEYDVDFSVADTDRKVIAIAEDGNIKIATKNNFEINTIDNIETENKSASYDGRYDVATGEGYLPSPPWIVANQADDFLAQFSSSTDDEAVRGNFDLSSESILAFAIPRPENISGLPREKGSTLGHVLVRSSTDFEFHVLKSGATQWADPVNLNALINISSNYTYIYGFGGKFYILVYNTVVGLPFNIFVYNPADDSAVTVTNTGFTAFDAVSRSLSIGWVDDGTDVYFLLNFNTTSTVIKIEVSTNTPTVWGAGYTPSGSNYIDIMPIGIKDGVLYSARLPNPTGNAIVLAFDIGTQVWSTVAGGYLPPVTVASAPAGMPGFTDYYFYDSATDFFYGHDDSVGRKIVRTKDFVTWSDVVVPDILGTISPRVTLAGAGYLVIQTDFLQFSQAGTTASVDEPMYFSSLKLSTVDAINRFKGLGITSDSKASVEVGKISKITVQKVAILDGFTGLTISAPVFMGDEGTITQDVEDIISGEYRLLLGYAVSTTEVDIQMGEPILNIPNEMLTDSVPIGAMIFITGNIVPTGFIKADGSAHLRSLYPTLNDIYAAENYPYGDGDGSTTFNVPDYTEVGTEIHAVKARYISDTSVEENAQLDNRIKEVEDAQIASDAKLALTIDPVLETSSVNVDIASDQELFIDGTSSTVTSDGRKPINGMDQGDYLPPKIEIDGKWYDNPSVKMFADRGCFGFFEDWKNQPWREASDWAVSNATISDVGDKLFITTTGVNGYVRIVAADSAIRHDRIIVDKGIGDEVYLGNSVTPSENCKYTWSTGLFIDGANCTVIDSILLTPTKVMLMFKTTSTTVPIAVLLPNSGDTCTISEVQACGDGFLPPYGQDGNSGNPARAYNFDKWDYPISFKFKPQFNFNTGAAGYLISEMTSAGVQEFGMLYDPGNDKFQFEIGALQYYVGHDGVNWDGGTTTIGDATAFVDNTILQSIHDLTIFIDKNNDLINLWIDGDRVMNDVAQDLSTWNPRDMISIGGVPQHLTPEDFYSNTYFGNFCVHPKTQTLPVVQTLAFRDPNKQYGKNAQWFLDQFGGFPGKPHENLVDDARAWVEVTSQRTGGVNYTNNTGRDIEVSINSATPNSNIHIDGIPVAIVTQSTSIKTTAITVPNGSVYSTVAAFHKWFELR